MVALPRPGPPWLTERARVSQRRSLRTNPRGFSLVELMVVIAVIGIITAVATPFFLSFLQAQRLRGAAQQVQTFLNQARQLAIARNISYRVEVNQTGTGLRFVRVSDSTPWTGPGTDGSGYFGLDTEIQLINQSGTNPTFNPFGAASTAGTLRVRNLQGTQCLDVIVSVSGRIRTAGAASCP